MKKSWVKKALMLTVALTMIVPMLAACTKKEEAVPPGQERVLRIAVPYGGGDDSWFRQQYVEAFEMSNPNVRIELVPAVNYEDRRFENNDDPKKKEPSMKESWKKVLEGANAVDVVISDSQSFRQLAKDGMLAKLDERIVQDKFDTSDIVPAVQDGIKAMGEGSLYGLAPTFNSSALLYNKKLFQDAGVELPKDGMTWDEVFSLAQRVSKGEGKNRTYGFAFDRYTGDPYYSMTYAYMSPLQLQSFDNKAEKMLVNSPKWEQAWDKVAKLYKDKVIPTQDAMMMDGPQQEDNPFAHDQFLSGKVAMMLTDMYYMNGDLASAARNAGKIKNFKPFEWDVVTVPHHSEVPGVSSMIGINNIFSINAKAPNADDAWNFIQYVNGEQWAKVRSRSTNYEMVTRKSYIKPKEGLNYNIAAFYNVKPAMPSMGNQELYETKSDLHHVDSIAQQLFNEVVTGKKTTKDALKEWETKGNEMLQKIKNGVPIQPEGVPGGVYR
ncbi:ABC transporter substrate-binding protein [Paenibacillus agilis]|uniref:Extracellular solute-binding protein n=1 Tax=Paenibacillus agilis TaxID=3020863 RepID=A0A559J312_9BACL|nr:extracellular solute-binding protein [Paenibacillus agilis]TVX94216.1 extracellular solute-binding protein [Paenibacillus agilis]